VIAFLFTSLELIRHQENIVFVTTCSTHSTILVYVELIFAVKEQFLLL